MDELTHHGILGMKWGVRRYQNADGSLTSAGKKRYGTKANFEKVQNAKAQAKAATKKAKKQAKVDAEIAKYKKKAEDVKNGTKEEEVKNKTPEEQNKKVQNLKTKPINEMTDDELKASIQRLRLENELKSLTPETKSLGRRFLDGSKDVITSSLYTASKDVGAKWLKKEMSKWLGVDEKTMNSAFDAAKKQSEKLKREAEDAENRKKKTLVDDFYAERERRQKEKAQEAKDAKQADKQAQKDAKQAEKEAKKEEKQNNQSNETEVVGEGTSKRKTEDRHDTSDAEDATFSSSNSDVSFKSAKDDPATETGWDYITYALALDDPNKKK